MDKFSGKRIKLAKRINKFDPMSYHALQSMEDLVRISSLEGITLFENKAMKQAIADEMLRDSFHIKTTSYLSELKKRLDHNIKKEIKVGDKIYSLKVSAVYDEGNMVGFVEVYRDITKKTNALNQLRKINIDINKDIMLAKNIQQAILPNIHNYKNIHFDFCHLPSDNLSGDIFDVVQIDSNRLVVYIADVVGHGISASIMTMFIRQTMRNILFQEKDFGPSQIILELKEKFSKLGLDVSQYFTMILALVDLEDDTMTYVNAGHNGTPIMFNDKYVAKMKNRGRFISNIFPPLDYEEKVLHLIKGDKFLFYTDGLLETQNSRGEFFGEENLIKWVKDNRKESDIIEKLTKYVNTYRWSSQIDDVAIVMMEIRG